MTQLTKAILVTLAVLIGLAISPTLVFLIAILAGVFFTAFKFFGRKE